jgi:hypothetical protein
MRSSEPVLPVPFVFLGEDDPMPSQEVEEFARILVGKVRDATIRASDALLRENANSPVAYRWKGLGAPTSNLKTVVPDIVDETVFSLLTAIDQGFMRLKFISSTGREIDLVDEGQGELAGWYMSSGGWRAMFSNERYVDDFADLAD